MNDVKPSEPVAMNSLQLYTQRETARLLRMSCGEVDRLIPFFKLSERRKRYRASDIQNFIEEKAKSSV